MEGGEFGFDGLTLVALSVRKVLVAKAQNTHSLQRKAREWY